MSLFWKIVLAVTCVALVGNGVLLYRKNNLTGNIKQTEKKYTDKITYRVSREFANKCISEYKAITGDSILNYFTISREDFLQAIQIDTSVAPIQSVYNFVRGSIGYDASAKKMHIFFSPVDSAVANSQGFITSPGHIVYLRGHYNNLDRQTGLQIPGNIGDKDGDGDYVLDLNAPCPTTCNPDDGNTILKKK
ncbi:MAG: hypothetical protein JWQ30_1844 [Sediminibacterium sp.]|nr:hypothetical protein [Sediminibacterium sp.]